MTVSYDDPAHAELSLRTECTLLVRSQPRVHIELVLSAVVTQFTVARSLWAELASHTVSHDR